MEKKNSDRDASVPSCCDTKVGRKLYKCCCKRHRDKAVKRVRPGCNYYNKTVHVIDSSRYPYKAHPFGAHPFGAHPFEAHRTGKLVSSSLSRINTRSVTSTGKYRNRYKYKITSYDLNGSDGTGSTTQSTSCYFNTRNEQGGPCKCSARGAATGKPTKMDCLDCELSKNNIWRTSSQTDQGSVASGLDGHRPINWRSNIYPNLHFYDQENCKVTYGETSSKKCNIHPVKPVEWCKECKKGQSCSSKISISSLFTGYKKETGKICTNASGKPPATDKNSQKDDISVTIKNENRDTVCTKSKPPKCIVLHISYFWPIVLAAIIALVIYIIYCSRSSVK